MQLEIKMPKQSRNNVFRGKQTKNKMPSEIFRGFADGKIVRLFF